MLLNSSRSGLAIHPLSRRLIKITPDHTAGVTFSTPHRAHVARLYLRKKKMSTDTLATTWSVVPPLLVATEEGFIPSNIRDEGQLPN